MIARPMLAVLALLALNASARAAEEVIVLVNGVPITADEVNQVVRGAISGRGEPPSSEEIAQLTEAARNSLIDFELLAQ
ncbi:MAG: hypothetical protein ABI629_15000, partial [bacterium]